jgi:putative peptide zinc metalloprotease protein
MSTAAQSLVSSSQRRVTLRVRPDLVATRHRYQGRLYWIVKDPVGLRYFRFQEEEYFLLQRLDGDTTLERLKDEFEAEFRPQRIRLEELGQFFTMLHRNGLILSDAPGQGEQLGRRNDERERRQWLARFSSVMSIRFRGINPDTLLDWLEPRVRWMFKPWALACGALLAMAALVLITVHYREFQARLPTFHSFFTPANAFWMMVVLAVTKIAHELGHGVTCKHFGGECHEMGFMLLLLTPCLYCNVSDSWMLPSKWQRIAIGAAGMIVEVVIASIATFLWWFSEPGLLNHLCLSTMFICSVSTLMFNGNPLMRYDGYYILSDLVEVPNLGQKASTLASRELGRQLLGIDTRPDPFLPQHHQAWYVAYAVVSSVYRAMVVFSVLFFLNELFKPYHLEVVGRMLGMISLAGLFGYPVWKLVRFFMVPGRGDLVNRDRLGLSACVTAAIVGAVFFLPLPHRVYGTLELEAHDAASIYTEVPGLLRAVYVKPGQTVEAGTKLAELENVDVNLAVEQLTGRRNQFKSQLLSLRHQRFEDDSAGLQLPEVQKSLAATEEQLQTKLVEQARLMLVAPVTGEVLPGPETPERESGEGELTSRTGSPFEPRNTGCLMTEQDLFCQIGDSRRMHALVVVEQSDIAWLKVGQTVDVKLDSLPNDILHGRIEEISSADVKVSPRHLSNKAGGELATKTDASGIERPLTTSYHVLVFPLDDAEGQLKIGMRGRAKIHATWQPIGMRLWGWFAKTFHFKL